MNDQEGFEKALEQARKSFAEGGVPGGKLLGSGHNQRVQLGNPILHGETAALQNSGRLPAKAYRGATMYTTLSPCDMCTGACLLYGISRVVIGENKTFLGGEDYLRKRGVEVVNMESRECQDLMEKFIKEKPHVWNEDIGEDERVHSKETK